MKICQAAGLVLYLLPYVFSRHTESLSMGEWAPAGTLQPPLQDPTDRSSMELLESGAGPEVRAGDLVQVKVYLREPAAVWVWTGREAEERDYVSLSRWGDLGAPRIRAALIGKAVGSKLRFAPDITRTARLPLRGFAAVIHTTMTDNGTLIKPRTWPDIDLGNRWLWPDEKAPGVELEILQARAANLSRRTALMRQSGKILNMFDMAYGPEREGILHWSALEAANLRFEIGPLYFSRYGEPKRLFGWSESYRRFRPPKDVPHEYTFCRFEGGVLRCPEE